MDSRFFHQWLLFLIYFVVFLLSWRRVLGFGNGRVELSTVRLSSAFLLLEKTDPLPSCGRLRMFLLDSISATATSEGETVRVLAIGDRAETALSMVLHCSEKSRLLLPVRKEASWFDPIVVASSSGVLRETVLADESLALELGPGVNKVEVLTIFNEAYESVEFQFAGLRELSRTIALGNLSSKFADQLSFVSQSTSSARAELAAAAPLAGCMSEAMLYFPADFSFPCTASNQELYFSRYPVNRKSLFLRQADGSSSLLPQPFSVRPSQEGEVHISEVVRSGFSQWIEFKNTTSVRQNLRGAVIIGGALGNGNVSISTDVWLEPYGYAVISRKGQNDLPFPPDWETLSLSLADGEPELILKAQSGSIVDRSAPDEWSDGAHTTPWQPSFLWYP